MGADNNQEDNDDYLPYLENVLKRIHTEYYSRYEAYQRQESTEVPDLSKIIPELRGKTLKGTTIVFSRLLPQGSMLPFIAEYNCTQHLGAKVEKNVVLRSENATCTTHLIATNTRMYNHFYDIMILYNRTKANGSRVVKNYILTILTILNLS